MTKYALAIFAMVLLAGCQPKPKGPEIIETEPLEKYTTSLGKAYFKQAPPLLLLQEEF